MKRKALGELNPNSLASKKRRNRTARSRSGCALCKIHLYSTRSVGMNTSARLAPARLIRRSNLSYKLVEKGVHLYIDMAGSVPRSPVHHLVAEDGIART